MIEAVLPVFCFRLVFHFVFCSHSTELFFFCFSFYQFGFISLFLLSCFALSGFDPTVSSRGTGFFVILFYFSKSFLFCEKRVRNSRRISRDIRGILGIIGCCCCCCCCCFSLGSEAARILRSRLEFPIDDCNDSKNP